MSAEIVLGIRENCGLKLWGVLSSEEQWLDWDLDDTERLFRVMESADYEYRIDDHKNDNSRTRQLNFISSASDILIIVAANMTEDLMPLVAASARQRKFVYILEPETLFEKRLPILA